MNLWLVYRILRRWSVWLLDDYYCGFHVEGMENVPEDGPVILASSHHNELVDIAMLAATIPHGRLISFWAKASGFKIPVLGSILSSVGAIPVKRNPNNSHGASTPTLIPAGGGGGNARVRSPTTADEEAHSNESLFLSSSRALARGGVIGVFPEGTSYTEPSIVQLMSGTAWAGVEYLRWARAHPESVQHGERVKIIPVGIVYTDKARYLSRVVIKYGTPIDVAEYARGYDDLGDPANAKEVVRAVMQELEKQMVEYTINAPDWDTMHAAIAARDLLWKDERNIPLKDWVAVSQRLINLLSPASGSTPASEVVSSSKSALATYRGFLHHTQISHTILDSIVPTKKFTTVTSKSLLHQLIPSALLRLPYVLLHTMLFLPPFVLHLPAYLSGVLAERAAPEGEEEAKAQMKGIAAGFGFGGGIGLLLGLLWRSRQLTWAGLGMSAGSGLGAGLAAGKNLVNMVLVVWTGVWAVSKWHNALVFGAYRRLERVITSYKLLLALLCPPKTQLSTPQLTAYSRPPLPPVNPYIKRRKHMPVGRSALVSSPVPPSSPPLSSSMSESSSSVMTDVWDGDGGVAAAGGAVGKVSPRYLIGPLLEARAEAYVCLSRLLADCASREDVEFLKSKGARLD